MQTPRLAGIADIVPLSWTAALAFTRKDGRDRKLHAVLEWPAHLALVAGHTIVGRAFTDGRRSLVSISQSLDGGRLSALCSAVVVAAQMLLAFVATALLTRTFAAASLAMLIPLLAFAPPATRSMRPGARQAARRLTTELASSSEPMWIFTHLSRRLTAPAGSGLQLLLWVMSTGIPRDSRLGCTAEAEALVPLYRRCGLEQLDGTLAMATPTAAGALLG
ncbi:hypothetical protein [Paenarthrobacter nicotinovorans]|uniref:hypothetical protein n=1 Tax=Paenarthrobacter nicotinovorans TaxID=29320 RepID=UPI0011A796B3|nr:hypothetical protein [Paenarthrobacter nicotinovorans]